MASYALRKLHRRVSSHAGLIATVLAACLLLFGLDGWRTWQNWSREVSVDKIETANLARSLAQHAHDAIAAADNAVVGLRTRLEMGDTSPGQLERIHATIMAQVRNMPGIQGLFVYDAQGNWLASPADTTPRQLNNSDREYFKYHQSHAERGVHVGPAIRSRSNGRWVITISRRMDAADGSFAGVVLATIQIDRLQAFYDGFNVGKQGVISLDTASGIVIARSPGDHRSIGTDVSASPIFTKLLPSAPANSYESESAIDGVRRLGSYRRVDDYPLVLIVAHAVDEMLADWRSDASLHLGISGFSALFLALMGVRVAGNVERRRAAEKRYRLLAVNSSDAIMCVAMDGNRLYVSPALTALTGWTVEEAMQQRWGEMVHPDDQATVEAMRLNLLADARQTTLCYRYACKDGSYLWVEAKFSLDAGDMGEQQQFIANIRDISERKAAEEQLESLNQALALQASTDGLTGLANRRQFDGTLELEWRRAMRDSTPLSLLLLDIDRFKLYNDHYGHQGGDSCLQAVAAALAGLGRRPADLVARYGGEEMVVLLPGADAEGAANVAEQLRATIEALAIPHTGNVPVGVVTASFGVATACMQAQDGPLSAAELIAAADAALYEAKRTGRNRVVPASAVPVSPTAPVHPEEEQRLADLHRYRAAGAAVASESLDRVARLTASLFNVPIAVVSLVGETEQLLLAKFGLHVESCPRETSFCAHTIAGDGVFTIADASRDPRFATNPFVDGEAGIRFYAGTPLVTASGRPLGALCIIDQAPRPPLTSAERVLLTDFAALAASYMDQRLAEAEAVR